MLSKAELLKILQQPEARREGVVVVRTLGHDVQVPKESLTGGSDVQIQIMKGERQPTQLSSGAH